MLFIYSYVSTVLDRHHMSAVRVCTSPFVAYPCVFAAIKLFACFWNPSLPYNISLLGCFESLLFAALFALSIGFEFHFVTYSSFAFLRTVRPYRTYPVFCFQSSCQCDCLTGHNFSARFSGKTAKKC